MGVYDTLQQTVVSGTAEQCGEQYGERFRFPVRGFYRRELQPNDQKRAFAKASLPFLEQHTPEAFAWLQGLVRTSGLSLLDATLLQLHEEHWHTAHLAAPEAGGHCTAFGAVRESTGNGESVLGQNWDWNNSYYGDSGVLLAHYAEGPSTLTYHYPGLSSCCGINSEGLTLMWTSAGFVSPVNPRPGVPTYALTHELLRKRSAEDARIYLERLDANAGCFLFLLADARGDAFIAEGLPGRIAIEPSTLLYRSNLYCFPAIVERSAQDAAHPENANCSLRERVIREIALKENGAITEELVRNTLTAPPLFRADDLQTMTVDSIVANCTKKTLAIARGGDAPGVWTTYRF